MQDSVREATAMPAPQSQQSSSSVQSGGSSIADDDDPVDLLASFMHQGSLSHVVQLLKEPYWKANKLNRSIIDRHTPAEINRSDNHDQLLLTVALKAKAHSFYFFCLVLEKGADPEAFGGDGRRTDWEFEEGGEQDECRVEWEKAVVAKRDGRAYTMPPGLDREIEMAARQQLHALKLVRNAAVFMSEPSGWIAPAPAPMKRPHSPYSSPSAETEVPNRPSLAKRPRQASLTPPPVPQYSPAPFPPPSRPSIYRLEPLPAATTSATSSQDMYPSAESALSSEARKDRQRRQRKAHIVLPLESIPAYIASSSEGITAEQIKREKDERDLAALSRRYSSVPPNLVPKRNIFIPAPHRPDIVPIDEGATLELSASGKIYTPQNLKPFACTKEGCDKRFKNANGLKYHRKHGKCSFSGTDGDGNVLGKPFVCHDEACGKRYKNKNGLRYHYENSGAHGVAGADMLANDTHPAPQYGPSRNDDDDDRQDSQELQSE